MMSEVRHTSKTETGSRSCDRSYGRRGGKRSIDATPEAWPMSATICFGRAFPRQPEPGRGPRAQQTHPGL